MLAAAAAAPLQGPPSGIAITGRSVQGTRGSRKPLLLLLLPYGRRGYRWAAAAAARSALRMGLKYLAGAERGRQERQTVC